MEDRKRGRETQEDKGEEKAGLKVEDKEPNPPPPHGGRVHSASTSGKTPREKGTSLHSHLHARLKI